MLLRKIPGPWETESNFLSKTSPADQTSTVEWLSPNIWNKIFFNLHFILEHKNSVLSYFNSKVIFLSLIVILLMNGIISISYRENEPPNLTVVATILKEGKEIEQIQNDSLCTERRIIGMFEWGLFCQINTIFGWNLFQTSAPSCPLLTTTLKNWQSFFHTTDCGVPIFSFRCYLSKLCIIKET